MLIYTGFPDSGLYNTCDKVVSQSFRSREVIYRRGLFPAFSETEKSQKTLPALDAFQMISVQNNQYAIVREA